MAKVTTYKKWGIPLGWWIWLTHGEACNLTSSSVNQIRAFLISLIPGPWAKVVALVIAAKSEIIRRSNERSGKKGVKILFTWATGMITSVERRGKGRSPC